jgi:gas vesicle protein
VITYLLPHLLAHVSAGPTPVATPTRPPGADTSGGISGLETAVIGVIGSVIGGIVGGVFALRATASQSKREREEASRDRSRQAAMNIADALSVLEETLLDRSRETIDANGLDRAYNVFSRTVSTQSIPITDDELRRRIEAHRRLVFEATDSTHVGPAELAGRVDRPRAKGDAMSKAIEAHYRNIPLPADSDL